MQQARTWHKKNRHTQAVIKEPGTKKVKKGTGTSQLSKKNLAQASCLPSTPTRARSPRAQPHSHWWWAPVEDDVGDDADGGEDGDDDLYDFKTTFLPLFPPPLMEGAAAGGEKIRKIFETANTHKQTSKHTNKQTNKQTNTPAARQSREQKTTATQARQGKATWT